MQAEDGIGTIGGEEQDKTMYYYEGSILPVEWTNQHGCGQNSKVKRNRGKGRGLGEGRGSWAGMALWAVLRYGGL